MKTKRRASTGCGAAAFDGDAVVGAGDRSANVIQLGFELGPGVCNRTHQSTKDGKEVVMNIIRWNPFRESAEMEGRLNRFARGAEAETLVFGDWVPAVDIRETETEFVVTADLPEVKKEEVKVTFYEGVLTIEGERKVKVA
jgi:Hsp20/alpha crystallin family protein